MDNKQIGQAVDILKKGGVIAYPTDTLYGIGCDALNQNAIRKIFELKGRDYSKPLSIACSSIEMVKKYVFLSKRAEKIVAELLPGPFTLIINKKPEISDLVTAGSDQVGVRIPGYAPILKVIEQLGRPIITTSANQSGEKDIKTLADIKIPVDFIFSGECKHNQPSTVFDPERMKIYRKGVGSNELEHLINIWEER